MLSHKLYPKFWICCFCLIFTGCIPALVRKEANRTVPQSYNTSVDTTNSQSVKWKDFFTDPNLNALIDTALGNNQGLNIVLQDIVIAKNDVRARKGQYLPFLGLGPSASVTKEGRYTRFGAVDDNIDIEPGRRIPDPLANYMIGATVSWEADIWRKLRNSRKSAMYRYLASTEGKNFMVTLLVADIANSYFELMSLDNQLEILRKNIDIQQNALSIVKLQKQAAKVTELAVRRFEAEVLKNQSRQYDILQEITMAENRINFLTGRFPRPVARNSQTFIDLVPKTIYAGIPSQLLQNRPDIRQAELELSAAKLNVKVTRANFYPSLLITAGAGYQAFSPKVLFQSPESIIYALGGQLIAPLINRNGITADYLSANARQVQSIYNYQRSILNAHIEVANQLSNINNLANSFDLKNQQVQTLTRSIDISTGLFNSARADYMEVLLTQRDALESRFDLIDIKKRQLNAMVDIYQALGGGWK
ncbi:MAG: efflux transporter outer membrane subunit [Opitutaceae bacterium]|nr:efflux transporter outer membrane subunit [Cytophagales bacterium]